MRLSAISACVWIFGGFVSISTASAARFDELTLKDGKTLSGRVVEDSPDAIEFEADKAKPAKFPKSKIARVVISYVTTKAPAGAAPAAPAKASEAKQPVYEDRSLGVAFEAPQGWTRYPESKRGAMVIAPKKRDEADVLIRVAWTMAPIDTYAADLKKSEISKLDGAAVKDEAAPASGTWEQKRLSVDYKDSKAKRHRDYVLVKLPGRILTISFEALPAGLKFAKQRVDALIASMAETEPEWAMRYDQDAFGLTQQPEGSLLFKGFESYKSGGGLEGRRYAWFSQSNVSLSIGVLNKDADMSEAAVEEWVKKEYGEFSNVRTKETSKISLGGLPAVSIETEIDTKDGKKQTHRVAAFYDVKRLYLLEAVFFDKPQEKDERAYDQLLSVFRTPGMAARPQ